MIKVAQSVASCTTFVIAFGFFMVVLVQTLTAPSYNNVHVYPAHNDFVGSFVIR